jgi:hypothetical protein
MSRCSRSDSRLPNVSVGEVTDVEGTNLVLDALAV